MRGCSDAGVGRHQHVHLPALRERDDDLDRAPHEHCFAESLLLPALHVVAVHSMHYRGRVGDFNARQ